MFGWKISHLATLVNFTAFVNIFTKLSVSDIGNLD
jgi:hypothetical protein